MRLTGSSLLVLLLLCGVSCAKKGEALPPAELQVKTVGGTTFAVPRATAFRMSGDYSENVGITLNPDGTLAYYPAPTDITPLSAPYDLGNGWWLNRQGISEGSVFTKWTFEEYAALKEAPSRQELLDAVIPGAMVTEMKRLPVALDEALKNPRICIEFCK